MIRKKAMAFCRIAESKNKQKTKKRHHRKVYIPLTYLRITTNSLRLREIK